MFVAVPPPRHKIEVYQQNVQFNGGKRTRCIHACNWFKGMSVSPYNPSKSIQFFFAEKVEIGFSSNTALAC